MKKILLTLVTVFAILPSLAFAQVQGDVNSETVSCIFITHNLSYRSRDASTGGDVSTLQDFLQSQGYLNIEPTGYFGLLTKTAVKAFQSANGILNSGYVGPITRAKLNSLYGCGATSGVGSGGVSGSGNTTSGGAGGGYVSPITIPTGTLSITPNPSTTGSGWTVVLRYTTHSNAVSAKLYLSCPTGISSTFVSEDRVLAYNELCNTSVPIDVQRSGTYELKLTNNTSQPQNVVPNFYEYTSDNPNYAKGVSSQITVNPAITSTQTTVTPTVSITPATLHPGDTATIGWNGGNGTQYFIYYEGAQGQHESVLVRILNGAGNFNWTVPGNLLPGSFRIRATPNTAVSAYDYSAVSAYVPFSVVTQTTGTQSQTIGYSITDTTINSLVTNGASKLGDNYRLDVKGPSGLSNGASVYLCIDQKPSSATDVSIGCSYYGAIIDSDLWTQNNYWPAGNTNWAGIWTEHAEVRDGVNTYKSPSVMFMLNPATNTIQPVSNGTLTISASTQPSPSLATEGATGIPFTKFALTNTGTTAVIITGVEVQRTGLGNDLAFSSAGLTSNGVVLGAAMIDGNHQAHIYSPFTINSGETKTLTIVGNMASNLSSYAGQVVSLSVIGINTTATVSGSFPVTGTNVTISSTTQIPTISYINPTSVIAGGTVSIYGTNFSQNTYVRLDGNSGISITPNSYTPTTLTFVVPSNTSVGTHGIQVGENGSTSATPWSNPSVSLTITALAPTATLSASPTSLVFNSIFGGSSPVAQLINVSAPTNTSWTVSASSNICGNRFSTNFSNSYVSGSNGNGNIYVYANSTGLEIGTCAGNVTISGNFTNSPIIIPVTLTVTAATQTQFTAPMTLNVDKINYNVGEATQYSIHNAPANATIRWWSSKNGVSTAEVAASYGQTTDGSGTSTLSGNAWTCSDVGTWTKQLQVLGVINGVTNPMATASFNVVANSSCPTNTTSTLSVSPASLTFTTTTGGASPTAQYVYLTTTNNLSWTVSASSNTGGNWLSTSYSNTPISGGTGSGYVYIYANSASLSAGTYTGNISFTGNFTGSPKTVPVTLVVGAAPTQTVSTNVMYTITDTTTNAAASNATVNLGDSFRLDVTTNPVWANKTVKLCIDSKPYTATDVSTGCSVYGTTNSSNGAWTTTGFWPLGNTNWVGTWNEYAEVTDGVNTFASPVVAFHINSPVSFQSSDSNFLANQANYAQMANTLNSAQSILQQMLKSLGL